jgi:tetraacyldisaccharide 4'-kinase
MKLDQRLQRLWYGPAWRSLPLWPLALLFRLLVALRRALYRLGVLRVHRVDGPVVVVGNITVGGTGKTPVAGWLARQLTLRGRRVGIVLRGYGGTHRGRPRVVTPQDDPRETGDEAVVHARRGAAVVVIGADRVAAARHALAAGAEIVVCDDGLQHTRLASDFTIAVVDAARLLGNGLPLPAGPLREPPSRLDAMDAVVITRRGGSAAGGAGATRVNTGFRPASPLVITASLSAGQAVNLATGERRDLARFRANPRLHAVAGIGHPEAFFASLRASGLAFVEHALPDHARLEPEALPFETAATVLMTEKDAVKCQACGQPDWWWVDLEVEIERAAAETLLTSILERTGLAGAGVRLG